MKRIILTILFMLIPVCLIAGEPPYNFRRLDRNIDIYNLNNTIQDLYSSKQDARFRIVTSTPSATTMNAGEVLILKQTGNIKIFIKDDDGSVYYTSALTAL